MKTIKLTPNGVTLSALRQYAQALDKLVYELRLSYASKEDDSEFICKLIGDINANAITLGFPEIDVDMDFIKECRKLG